MEYTKQEILGAFVISKSKSETGRILGITMNGAGFRKINKWINVLGIDTSHFDRGCSKRILFPRIVKICPVCGSEFETKSGLKKEKTVCSRGCSNTYFRSGKNNGNYKHGGWALGYESDYRTTCFTIYPYKCALCNWTKTVDVHHIDNNNKNNDISNLIPLCPNHHRLTIMKKHRDEIEIKIQKWKEQNELEQSHN